MWLLPRLLMLPGCLFVATCAMSRRLFYWCSGQPQGNCAPAHALYYTQQWSFKRQPTILVIKYTGVMSYILHSELYVVQASFTAHVIEAQITFQLSACSVLIIHEHLILPTVWRRHPRLPISASQCNLFPAHCLIPRYSRCVCVLYSSSAYCPFFSLWIPYSAITSKTILYLHPFPHDSYNMIGCMISTLSIYNFIRFFFSFIIIKHFLM